MDVTDDGVAINDLVVVVKNVIKLANMSSTDAGRDLRVTSVQLVLHAIATVSAGGGLDFRLPVLGMKLRVGASVTRRDTHTIDMTLVPPDLLGQHEIRDGEIETVLLDAVEAIRAVMTRAAQGDDPFLLRAGSVELGFAIAKDGTIALGASGELKDEVTHSLRMTLAAPS
jgi:Trypsin-co-occurring domain 2